MKISLHQRYNVLVPINKYIDQNVRYQSKIDNSKVLLEKMSADFLAVMTPSIKKTIKNDLYFLLRHVRIVQK